MRLYIDNLKDSELIPLKVELQMAAHVVLVSFMDRTKAEEKGDL